jgi:hypothetical protein
MEDNKDLTQIYLLLQDLDKRVAVLEKNKQETDPGVVTNGVPQFVKQYLDKLKEGN